MGISDVVVVLVLVVVVVIFLRASVCAVSILEKFSSQLVRDGNTIPSCLVSAITGVGHREESSTQLLSQASSSASLAQLEQCNKNSSM